MNGIKLLTDIFALCEGEVSITYNAHKSMYQTVGQYLNDLSVSGLGFDLDSDVLKKMLELNQMVSIQAYQRTPIGFYLTYHWDLEMAAQEMLATLKSESAK